MGRETAHKTDTYGKTSEQAHFTAFGDTEAEVRASLVKRAEEFFGGQVTICGYDGGKPQWYFHPVDGTIFKDSAGGKKMYAQMYAQRADGGDAIAPKPATGSMDEDFLRERIDEREGLMRQELTEHERNVESELKRHRQAMRHIETAFRLRLSAGLPEGV